MSHYYSDKQESKSNESTIHFKIREASFHLLTDNGVFSKSGLDFGSRLLLDSIIDIKSDSMLDLGCGYGPLGIVYKHFNPNTEVTMTDVNLRAVELALKNVSRSKFQISVVESDGFEKISCLFDLIVTNPPIRAGKGKIYQFFQESYEHLFENGSLMFVINKKHGAQSAINFCSEIYKKVEVVNKQSGYQIVHCKK